MWSQARVAGHDTANKNEINVRVKMNGGAAVNVNASRAVASTRTELVHFAKASACGMLSARLYVCSERQYDAVSSISAGVNGVAKT